MFQKSWIITHCSVNYSDSGPDANFAKFNQKSPYMEGICPNKVGNNINGPKPLIFLKSFPLMSYCDIIAVTKYGEYLKPYLFKVPTQLLHISISYAIYYLVLVP